MGLGISVSVSEFVKAISEVLDLGAPELNNHHKKVAYISWRIAQEINLPEAELQELILAAMLHDIGAFSLEDRLQALEFESGELIGQCASLGFRLLDGFEPLSKAAGLIRYHYLPYNTNRDVPLGSYIIHLADRVSVLIDDQREIFDQVQEIMETIRTSQDPFHPVALEAFEHLSGREYFWLETCSIEINSALLSKLRFSEEQLDIVTLTSFAKLICHLIDFRSRFTATHSSGVAAVATELTRIIGYDEDQCQLVLISGYLHDLGKIAVPNNLLEKPAALDVAEYNTVKKHAYYSYLILSNIQGMEEIAAWGAYHHERGNGNGYPFGKKGEDLGRLSQIMACADIFTATAEDRPYRTGMDKDQISTILTNTANEGGIDKEIIDNAIKEFDRLNAVRIDAQAKAHEEYEAFYQL